MEIKTKFNVGDSAYVYDGQRKYKKVMIRSIRITIKELGEVDILYKGGHAETERFEEDMFATKEEVLSSIIFED